ncbi:FAD-dependent oxidoreductase [Oleispirillum naphthae]|uniref:FAD-dependent oxidoreductase n=1 Tax=Oleispirillum naphthae TaxID=2838853 RepID=UPI0030826B11
MDTIASAAALHLGFGLSFADLYERAGLARLDAAFLAFVEDRDADRAARLKAARQDPDALSRKDDSALMLDLAPDVDAFIGALFGIGEALGGLHAAHADFAPLAAAKRLFVQRKAVKAHTAEEAVAWDGAALTREVEARLGAAFSEAGFARAVLAWMEDAAAHAEDLALAARFAAWASLAPEGRRAHGKGVLFVQPGKRDSANLVHAVEGRNGPLPVKQAPPEALRRRAGFALTDAGADLPHALDQAAYCITCHHMDKDSCARGMTDRAKGGIATNPLGRKMLGCPLEERISEMNEAKTAGHAVAALAIVCLDNPLCAGTGHRICNDCMVACIYQNQMRDPVNIPEVETRTLKDVLSLPWGFEIYALFTRWNPVSFRRPLPAEASGYSVLVAGLGPAGYSLAQRLLHDGHTVVAVDGLKIEPMDPALSGIDERGEAAPFAPIRDVGDLWQNLDDRVTAGFGGVAEYGITVRWDKNFLTLIRLILERDRRFRMFGGVRFGSTLGFDDAKAMGFDHVALCLGAGKPTLVPMAGKLTPGVRQASDFLMALQLTGAAHPQSVANLQVRLPVAVIGGGLTAIDSCTEALAYYPVQVEKFLARYETLAAEGGEAALRAAWNPGEAEIAEEFLAHGRALRAERAAAAAEGRAARVLELLQSWGGATLVYRRKLTDSPAYRNNHEEIAKALEEGIFIAEQWSPTAVHADAHGWAETLQVQHAESGETAELPAKTVIVAAGTIPNVTLAREGAGGLAVNGRHFQALDEAGEPVTPEKSTKPEHAQVLISAAEAGVPVSFFGDLHPGFAGNVVAAMASARAGAPVIGRTLRKAQPACPDAETLFTAANRDLRPTLSRVTRLAPAIVEVVVHAPLAARRFRPGQFFRLQNYAAHAKRTEDTLLAMEGVALTGAWVDVEAGELAMIVLEMGGSSSLCAQLQPGEPLVVMGPTGAPTELPENQTVLLAGGGLGNAVLFSIGRALKERGCRVLYFAGYRRGGDRFKVADILAASDAVVWCCDEAADFAPERPDDKTFTGNIVQAMAAYGAGELGETPIPLAEVDRIIAIGSDRMMAAVQAARHGVLAQFLKPCHHAVASINAPMQCMMKEICGQCLQRQVDPATGIETVVFTCAEQDQDMERVDFASLRERLSQNTVQESLTRRWIARELKRL